MVNQAEGAHRSRQKRVAQLVKYTAKCVKVVALKPPTANAKSKRINQENAKENKKKRARYICYSERD